MDMTTARRLALLSGVLALAIAAPVSAATPGKNGVITVERNGVFIVDTDPDTPTETVLFPADTQVGAVRFSPDGTRLAFMFFDDGIGGTDRSRSGCRTRTAAAPAS